MDSLDFHQPRPGRRSGTDTKSRALVLCTHLRPSRDKRRTSYFMQPLAGLQVASLIDADAFDVTLYHEDWHGPFRPERCHGWDLVFLTGLQADFDRMRQLAYHFRRAGSIVVAGGSVCTSFPEFATGFFDAVCVGGIETVPAVVADVRAGSLKPIYVASVQKTAELAVDYAHFRRAGINPTVHLMEASRGCKFKCTFCVVPAEVGGHIPFALRGIAASLDNAITNSPLLSFRRWYPLVLFYDNNFSDDVDHMRAVARLLTADRRVRGWAALVTQNILNDRALVAELATLKCVGLFVGLESIDPAMLRRYRKTQNLSRKFDVLDDIAYAESLGIAVSYGYLFDPRHQTAAQMEHQLATLADDSRVPMPIYLSMISPIAGTESFWDDLEAGRLAPNLLMRELDGETIAFGTLADTEANLAEFVGRMFRRPWTVVSPRRVLVKTLRRIVRAGLWDPIRWIIMASANLHCFVWSSGTPKSGRSFLPGRDPLDPQYAERPADISDADVQRYFEPIRLTDENGAAAAWLRPFAHARASRRTRVRAEV